MRNVPPTNRPSQTPLLDEVRSLPEVQKERAREWVKGLTAAQLDQLVTEMEQSRDVPEVFKEASVKEMLDQRLAEEGEATSGAKSRLDRLQRGIENDKKGKEAQAQATKKKEEEKASWTVLWMK